MANKNLQNIARISGVLVSKKVDTGLNRAGEFMSVELVVRAGKDEHTIRLYSNKLKQDGTENKIYKGLKTIADNYKTIEEVGEELAERVNITGELAVNRYVGKDGQLKEYRQIRSNFCNRHDKGEFVAKSEFAVKGVVDTVMPKVDVNGETEGLEITLIIPNNRGEIDKVKFMVREEAFFGYIEDNFVRGEVVQLGGNILNRVDENAKAPVSNAGFGVMPQSSSRRVNELLCLGGNALVGMNETSPYTEDEIKEALVKFNQKLVELQSKPAPATTNTNTGFGVQNKTGFNNIDIKDMPF